jgi:hypothetical protein
MLRIRVMSIGFEWSVPIVSLVSTPRFLNASHPEPLALGRRDLVPDALGGDLALELREGQKHVERQAPMLVAVLKDWVTDTKDAARRIEHVDDLGEVRKRPGEPVDLVDHDLVDPAAPDIVEEVLQRRAFQTAAGQAAIVVAVWQHHPALVLLAGDVGGAGLPLGMERVELLLQPVLGALAGIDGAADRGRWRESER